MISVGKWTFHSLHAVHINTEREYISSHAKQQDMPLRKRYYETVKRSTGFTGHWCHITSRNQHESFILREN